MLKKFEQHIYDNNSDFIFEVKETNNLLSIVVHNELQFACHVCYSNGDFMKSYEKYKKQPFKVAHLKCEETGKSKVYGNIMNLSVFLTHETLNSFSVMLRNCVPWIRVVYRMLREIFPRNVVTQILLYASLDGSCPILCSFCHSVNRNPYQSMMVLGEYTLRRKTRRNKMGRLIDGYMFRNRFDYYF